MDASDYIFFGWDNEMQVAFRKRADGAGDYTKQLEKPKDAQAGDAMIAVFNDGQEHELIDFSVQVVTLYRILHNDGPPHPALGEKQIQIYTYGRSLPPLYYAFDMI